MPRSAATTSAFSPLPCKLAVILDRRGYRSAAWRGGYRERDALVTFMQRRERRRRDGDAGRRPGHVYAALDLGTNNCRLLVARPRWQGFDVIDSFSRIVRLGEGLQASGRLSEAAVERTLQALRVCAGKIRRRQVTRLRCVATEACRLAGNCEDFVARAAEEAGVDLEIITNREEASLAATGCAPLLRRDRDRALAFDIGGGSTEVMWLAVHPTGQPEVIDSISIPWGVVRMAEAFGGDVVSPADYDRMVRVVGPHLAPFEERYGMRAEIEAGRVQMIGTSGTVTTLAGIHLSLPRYQRDIVDGQFLSFRDVAAVSDRLRGMDFAARAAEPCVGAERADLVVAGCAILAAICAEWPVGRLRVADRGVREGILFNLITADRLAPGAA